MSPQVERLTGYRLDEWVGQPGFFDRVLHPDDRCPVLDEMRASREEQRPFSRDYRLVGPDGRVVWIHDESVPITDEHGEPELIQGYFVDITERKELEQQLMHAQKLEAVGRLAGGVAHDFNNFLTAIGGYTRLALEAVPAGGPVNRYLREVLRAVEAATRLTRQLLTFSRREAYAPKLLNLSGVVSAMQPMLRRVAGDWVRLDLALGDPPAIHADAAQLEQVVVNVVANARDAHAGTVTLRTGRAFRKGREHAFVSVADDGLGMDAATRERAFDPFFTTKDREEGTGLGLSIVHGVVAQCGGHVEVETAPNAGTTVTILLPAAPLG
jgi:PAS domain S-box-containing protein